MNLEKARYKGFQGEGPTSKFNQRRPDLYKAITLDTYLWNPYLFHGLYGHRPLPEGRRSTIVVVQMRPTPGDVIANKASIESSLFDESAKDADLIVYPELATSGYVKPESGGMASVAEPIPGPTVTAIAVFCRETGKHVVLGVAEVDGDQLFNTAVLVGPDGLVGKHRQMHLDRWGRMWAKPGNKPPPTFDVPVGRVGLLVGHDINFPEASRLLALDGADIICVPAALTFPTPAAVGPTSIPYPEEVNVHADPLHWIIWRQRSTDDFSYFAIANQYGSIDGERYLGLSGIFTPLPIIGKRIEVIAPSEGEATVSLEVDTRSTDKLWPSATVRLKEFLGLRQPGWYTLCQVEKPPILQQGG